GRALRGTACGLSGRSPTNSASSPGTADTRQPLCSPCPPRRPPAATVTRSHDNPDADQRVGRAAACDGYLPGSGDARRQAVVNLAPPALPPLGVCLFASGRD